MQVNKSKLILVILLICSWLPATGFLQGLVYLSPIFILIFLIFTNTKINFYFLFFIFAFIFISLLSVLINVNNISIFNFALAVFTHFSIFLFIFRIIDSEGLEDFFSKFMAKICIFETSLGFIQLLISTGGSLSFSYAGSGDNVTGTLMDNSHLFVVKMLISFLYFVCVFIRGDKRNIIKLGILFSLIGAILGSALFTTGLFFISAILFFLLAPKVFYEGYSLEKLAKIKFSVILMSFFSIFIFSLVQEQNVKLILSYYETSVDALSGSRDYGLNKVISAINVLREQFSSDFNLIFGYGFGQYSSRASLIASGEYLRSQISFIPIFISPIMQEYLIPYWNKSIWSVQFQDGVMNQPFFSILSIFTELGVLGFILSLLGLFFSIRYTLRIIKKYKRRSAFAFFAIICVFPFLLFTDNWLEYPGVVLHLVAMAMIFNVHKSK